MKKFKMYYTVREIAEMFGKTTQTVRNWIRCGRLKDKRPKSTIFHKITSKDLEEFKIKNRR